MAANIQTISGKPHAKRTAWKALESHYRQIRSLHLRDFFSDDPKRGERLTAQAIGLYLDYSKNRITDQTIKLLLQLAEESGLQARMDAMFRGEKINITENRAALHVALRAPRGASIFVNGLNVVPQVQAVLEKMAHFCNMVRSGDWVGYTGKRIRNIINIGIGGSDLGPVMVYEALKDYSDRSINFRFVSNVDGTDFREAVRDLDPSETLFIICSKTFTTLETMTNARSARACCCKECVRGGDYFIARADFLGHEAGKKSIAARRNPDCIRAARVCGDGLLTLVHFRSQDKVLGFEHFRDGGVNFGLDGRVLRLKIEQRYIHDLPPPSVACITWCQPSARRATVLLRRGRDTEELRALPACTDSQFLDTASHHLNQES